MPVYDPNRVEHTTVNGHVYIIGDDGRPLPAYWAHPNTGGTFPAIALIHDWWGITDVERRLAHLFAQLGYYVIIPDLFDGKTATTPQYAKELVEALGENGYPRVDTALRVLEHHVRCNGSVGAVGLGMGGTLAFEAALTRDDLEAAVSFYGFPHRYLKRFRDSKAPVLALYGSGEPFVGPDVIERLRRELGRSPLAHEVVVLDGAKRDFFRGDLSLEMRTPGTLAWEAALAFLEKFLGRPARPPARQSVM